MKFTILYSSYNYDTCMLRVTTPPQLGLRPSPPPSPPTSLILALVQPINFLSLANDFVVSLLITSKIGHIELLQIP